jgi:hypothetical protein
LIRPVDGNLAVGADSTDEADDLLELLLDEPKIFLLAYGVRDVITGGGSVDGGGADRIVDGNRKDDCDIFNGGAARDIGTFDENIGGRRAPVFGVYIGSDGIELEFSSCRSANI